MDFWRETFKRLSFRVDYKKEDELKTAVIYFFSVFVFLRLLAVGLRQTEFFALVLTIGALVYLWATVHFVYELFKGAIKKKYKGYTKLYDAVFALLHTVILILVVYLMFAPINIGSENTIISLIASLLLIILPASFSDEIIDVLKKKLYPLMLFMPAMPNLTDINITGLQNFVSGKLPDLTSPFPYFDIINSLVSKYGLWLIVAVIVIGLFVLRIIKTVLQILLVLVIIWAITKYLGIF